MVNKSYWPMLMADEYFSDLFGQAQCNRSQTTRQEDVE